MKKVRMRFLGVWDIVGSFGLSFDTFINFQEINQGWNIDTVSQCAEIDPSAQSLELAVNESHACEVLAEWKYNRRRFPVPP